MNEIYDSQVVYESTPKGDNFKMIKNNIDITVQFSNTKTRYVIEPSKTLESQMVSTIMMNKNCPDIVSFIENLVQVSKNITNYCIGCCEFIPYRSDILTTCGDDKCKYKLEDIIVDNYVCEYINSNVYGSQFLIEMAYYATQQKPHISFEPFPNHFLKRNVIRERGDLAIITMDEKSFSDYNSQKDFVRLNIAILFIKDNFKNIEKYSREINNDKMLMSRFGEDVYYCLRFVFKSCKLQLDFEREDTKVKIFKVKNTFETEEVFSSKVKTEGNFCYLFHGSASNFWHSIIRNGLFVASGTKMQVNGAAYGPGIYTSNDYNFALGYSVKFDSQLPIVGVYEVVGTHEKYKKTQNIFVVPNKELCILRYLIHGNATSYSQHLNSLIHIESVVQKKENSAIMNAKGQKKLMKELSDIRKENVYNVELVYDNIGHWIVDVSNGTKLEIIFHEHYPFKPPFIFVKSPIFTEDSKYITDKGAICYEYLTPSNWSPITSIKSIILHIDVLIIQPAVKKCDGKYSYDLARQSYIKMAEGNGWFN